MNTEAIAFLIGLSGHLPTLLSDVEAALKEVASTDPVRSKLKALATDAGKLLSDFAEAL